MTNPRHRSDNLLFSSSIFEMCHFFRYLEFLKLRLHELVGFALRRLGILKRKRRHEKRSGLLSNLRVCDGKRSPQNWLVETKKHLVDTWRGREVKSEMRMVGTVGKGREQEAKLLPWWGHHEERRRGRNILRALTMTLSWRSLFTSLLLLFVEGVENSAKILRKSRVGDVDGIVHQILDALVLWSEGRDESKKTYESFWCHHTDLDEEGTGCVLPRLEVDLAVRLQQRLAASRNLTWRHR